MTPGDAGQAEGRQGPWLEVCSAARRVHPRGLGPVPTPCRLLMPGLRGPHSPPPGGARVQAGLWALLCAAANAGQAQHLLQPALGGPGVPPSFLLQPRSPSASWPCSLGAGTSPEAQSPPSGCRPRPLRIPPRLIAGPRGAGRHRAPNMRAGASLKGRPIHGGWQGPPHTSWASLSTGRPCALLLWLWCRRAAGTWDRAGRSLPRGDQGGPAVPGGGARYVIVLPGGPRIHGTSPREPRPLHEGVYKTQGQHNGNHTSGGIIAKDHEDVRFFFSHYQTVKRKEKENLPAASRGVSTSCRCRRPPRT